VQILEQKEWHTLLAEKDLSAAPVPEPMEFGYWKWHGYLVRYARTRRSRGVGDKPRPNLLLVHGFGASCDQWAKCFTQLGGDYDVRYLHIIWSTADILLYRRIQNDI
jgi:pimeloyl-ACP methyl ester carboxylesterase